MPEENGSKPRRLYYRDRCEGGAVIYLGWVASSIVTHVVKMSNKHKFPLT